MSILASVLFMIIAAICVVVAMSRYTNAQEPFFLGILATLFFSIAVSLGPPSAQARQQQSVGQMFVAKALIDNGWQFVYSKPADNEIILKKDGAIYKVSGCSNTSALVIVNPNGVVLASEKK